MTILNQLLNEFFFQSDVITHVKHMPLELNLNEFQNLTSNFNLQQNTLEDCKNSVFLDASKPSSNTVSISNLSNDVQEDPKLAEENIDNVFATCIFIAAVCFFFAFAICD